MMRGLLFTLLVIVTLGSCSADNRAIKIKGSDTEVNLTVEIAEAFFASNKGYSLAVSGGGSGLGIASLYNGQADIANSSRPLSSDEKKLFEEKGINIITNIFAEDATAVIVHQQNKIDSLDAETLGKIFSGDITNWKEINGEDMPINIYGRQSNSGTHSFIQKKLKIKFTNRAKEMNGNAQIMEGIKSDPSGIGYVGAGYLLGGGNVMKVKLVSIKGNKDSVAISPLDKEAIIAKRYFLQRPLYQFIPEQSYKKVKSYLDFEKTDKGKALIRKSGYYVLD